MQDVHQPSAPEDAPSPYFHAGLTPKPLGDSLSFDGRMFPGPRGRRGKRAARRAAQQRLQGRMGVGKKESNLPPKAPVGPRVQESSSRLVSGGHHQPSNSGRPEWEKRIDKLKMHDSSCVDKSFLESFRKGQRYAEFTSDPHSSGSRNDALEKALSTDTVTRLQSDGIWNRYLDITRKKKEEKENFAREFMPQVTDPYGEEDLTNDEIVNDLSLLGRRKGRHIKEFVHKHSKKALEQELKGVSFNYVGLDKLKRIYGPLDIMKSLAFLGAMYANNAATNSSASDPVLTKEDIIDVNEDGTEFINFMKAGRKIRTARFGHKNLHSDKANHLDVIEHLDMLQCVWIMSTGLSKPDFVDFLKAVLNLPLTHLKGLFEKMDCDSDGSLTWDEFLSYLLREVTHKWHFRKARGTFHLLETDKPPQNVGSPVKRILIIPEDTTTSFSSPQRYVLSHRDDTISVWNFERGHLVFHSWLPVPKSYGDGSKHQDSHVEIIHPKWVNKQGQASLAPYVLTIAARARAKNPSLSVPNSARDQSSNAASTASLGGNSSGNEASSSSLGNVPPSTSALVSSMHVHPVLSPYHADLHGPKRSGSQSARGSFIAKRGRQDSLLLPSRRTSTSSNPGNGRRRLSSRGSRTSRKALGHSSSSSSSKSASSGRHKWGASDVLLETLMSNNTKHRTFYPHSDMIYYAARQQIVVASADKTVNFYSYSAYHRRYALTTRLKVESTPQCIAIGGSYKGHPILFVGDIMGSVFVIELGNFTVIRRVELHAPTTVGKLMVLPNGDLLSAGMDGNLCISKPWLLEGNEPKFLRGHHRGITTFAYCPRNRVILSAGFDGRILVWNPITGKFIEKVKGHHNNLVGVCVNEVHNQMITVSSEKKIKVFDIRTLKCIQSFADTYDYTPNDEITSCAFDEKNEVMVTACGKLRFWPICLAPGNKMRSSGPAHSNLIVSVLYSTAFRQIVSVDVDGKVRLWDIFSGRSEFEFVARKTTAPLTAACLDHLHKRLLTSSSNGDVWLWNFNDGNLLATFEKRNAEMNALLFLPRSLQCVVGVGPECKVLRWPDHNAPKGTPLHDQRDNTPETRHQHEILGLDYHKGSLVSGDVAGWIFCWYVDSARYMKKYRLPSDADTGALVFNMAYLASPKAGSNKRGSRIQPFRRTPRNNNAADSDIFALTSTGHVTEGEVTDSKTSMVAKKSRGVPGVSVLKFAEFSGTLLLLIGTTDGRVFMLDLKASMFVRCFTAVQESVQGIAVHVGCESGLPERLAVVDCERTMSVWDISDLNRSPRGRIAQITVFEPYPEEEVEQSKGEKHKSKARATITGLTVVNDIKAFVTSSDTGEVTIWSLDGKHIAAFGQTSAWPIHDPHANVSADENKQKMNIYNDSDEEEVIISEYQELAEAREREANRRFAQYHPPSVIDTSQPASTRLNFYLDASEGQTAEERKRIAKLKRTSLYDRIAKEEKKQKRREGGRMPLPKHQLGH